MRKHGKLKFLAVLAAALFTFLSVQAPASATTGVDGFTVLYASHGDQAHHCEIAVKAGSYQAVICVDILTEIDAGSHSADGYGRVEVICQTSTGAYAPCKRIVVTGTDGRGGGGIRTFGDSCGDGAGSSACPWERFYATENVAEWLPASSSCDTQPNSDYDEWTVITDSNADVVLPSGQEFTVPIGSFSTGHYYICY